jgi:hypothetical protein
MVEENYRYRNIGQPACMRKGPSDGPQLEDLRLL